AEFPALTNAQAQFILAMRKYGYPAGPPLEIIEGEKPALNSPATERGFLLPETKENKMTFNFLNWTSKTFWVGAAMVVAGLIELVAPGTALSDIAGGFFGDIEPGLLISNGLAIVFGREAIEKVK
ncbi:MAG: hypothetical protein AAGM67_18280, partial [Bacteroidota bacterium]